MPAALSWEQELPPLLQRLRAAQERGRREESVGLRMEILSIRLGACSADELPGRVAGCDVKLLYNQGVDLRALGRYGEAARAWELGNRYAGYCKDDYYIKQFAVLGVHAHLDMIDFSGAAQRLGALLGQPLEQGCDIHAAIRAASELLAPGASAPEQVRLRRETLTALGRYVADLGRLGDAARAYAKALALPEALTTPTAAEEVAILLHEVHLDCGDFASCEQLRAQWAKRPMSELGRIKWQILHGTQLHLRAQLSEAEQLFAKVLAEHPLARAPESYRKSLRVAAWQRNHVLCALNRMEEAEELLRQLAGEGGWNEQDLRVMAAIQGAHRLAAVKDLPLTAREILSRELWTDQPAGDATDPETALERKRERVRDEWARVANAILLDLQHQRLEQAQRRFRWLEPWAATIDSPLIQARLCYLRALVSYYSGDLPTAAREAIEAMRRSVDLGLLVDEWMACRLCIWILERLNASESAQVAYLDRAQDLERRISTSLSETDRVLYRLNKWSEVDRRVSQELHALRAAVSPPATPDRPGSGLPAWRQQRQAAQRTQRVLHEVVASKRGENVPRPIRFRPSWLDDETAVLCYVVLPDRLELFLVLRSSVELMQLSQKTSRVELWHVARRLLRSLFYDAWSDERLRRAQDDMAAILGLEEVLDLLKRRAPRVRRLCIVPDDVLFHVPFSSLPLPADGGDSGDRVPLCTRFAVSLLPDLAWGLRCPFTPLAIQHGLGVAVESTTLTNQAGDRYSNLPKVTQDIEELKRATTGQFTRLPDEAGPPTKERVLTELPRASVVQFACHSDFNAEHPQSSGLVLTDAYLTVDDLSELPLAGLDLAVLGSCFGGNIAVLPGRELVGIPMALIDQGAGAAITALWEVDDDFSPRMSAALYPFLKDLGPVDSLAAAQEQLWSSSRPRDWAAFLIFQNGLTPRRPWRWLLWLLEKLSLIRRQICQRG